MKKIGQKLSYLTRIFLVISLLFSNLCSLTTVFAYEKPDAYNISVVNDKVLFKYTGKLDTEEEFVNIKFIESFSDLESDVPEQNEFIKPSVSVEELRNGVLLNSIVPNIKFDGVYKSTIQIYVENEDENGEDILLQQITNDELIYNDVGLNFLIHDTENKLVPELGGVYNVSYGYSYKFKFNTGGLFKDRIYKFNDKEYTGMELTNMEFDLPDIEFGNLYGHYPYSLNVELVDTSTSEVISYSYSTMFKYYDYTNNATLLNDYLKLYELDKIYNFASTSSEGKLLVYSDDKVRSVYEIINFFDKFLNSISFDVKFELLDNNGNDVLELYDKYIESLSEEELLVSKSREEFYQEINLCDDYVVRLSDNGLTISFKTLFIGDANLDGIVNNDDLVELINEVLGINDSKMDKLDLVIDGKLDLSDIIYLNEVINNKDWSLELGSVIGKLSSSLNVLGEDITTGDSFDVLYMVDTDEYSINGLSSLIEYDKSKLELISSVGETSWVGNTYDNKSLFIGNDYLDKNGKYSLVRFTFKALESGSSDISINNSVVVSGINTVDVDKASVSVLVNPSSDNTLSYLSVANKVIELVEGVFDYEINVDSYVSSLNLDFLTSNIKAAIKNIDMPEELSYGKNEVIITVSAENGDEVVYKINIFREEEKPVVNQVTYAENNYVEDTDKNVDVDIDKDTEIIDNNDKNIDNKKKDESKNEILSKIIIIVLILVVIAGLVYLIFRDDDSKKANKNINKLKKKDFDFDDAVKPEVVKSNKSSKNSTTKNNSSSKSNKKSNGSKKK